MMKERMMAIVIGFIMLGSIIGFAFMRNVPEGPKSVEFPNIINRTLKPEERVSILRSGRNLIEYLYPSNCSIVCVEKRSMYESFVNSKEFEDYVVLSTSEANETADWMIGLDGTRYELDNINNTEQLRKFFCEVSIRQPDICILQQI
jgi:hypothetical protein